MLHIVFEPSGAEALSRSFELDETLRGDILIIEDDYAVGPLGEIYEAEGWQIRKSWWEDLLQDSPYMERLNMVDDKLKVHQLKKQMEQDRSLEVWIWMGQNSHDVSGYYWLISQLKEYQGQLQVLYLNNLPFINEKGSIFYPTNLYEIQAKEFLKAKRLARVITLSEFELDPDEWYKLSVESKDAMVRILEGGKKLINSPIYSYDKEILTILGKSSTKLIRLLSNLFSKMKLKTGDVFLVWRIKELIAQGQIAAVGEWSKGWKDITLKATDGELFVEITSEPDQNENE